MLFEQTLSGPCAAGEFSKFRLMLIGVMMLWGTALAPAELAVQLGQNFTGSTFGLNTFALPADSNGAIGPLHFVELINGRFAVYAKTNGTLVQSSTDIAFWQNAGIPIASGEEVSDPRMLFDLAAQRWFTAGIVFVRATMASNSFLVAVSGSADPTGPWQGLRFVADPVSGNFADYPTLGVDANGVYLSANMFGAIGGSDVGAALVSIPKTDVLLSPPTATNATSFGLLSYASFGEVLQPVVNPGGTDGEVVIAAGNLGYDFAYHSNVAACLISNAAGPGTARLSAPVSLSVPPYFVPINPPQPDPAASDLDDGDARIGAMARQVGNIIYAVHGTETDVVQAGTTASGQAGICWYKIDASTFTVLQSGTLSDPVVHYFFPSIAANAEGTVVIGCNGSSTNSFVSSYAFVGETVNGMTTFGPPLLLKAGSASYKYTIPSYGASRWGDYSTTSVDPSDPTRFWTIQMVPTAPQEYITQITEVRAVRRPRLEIGGTPSNVTISWVTNATPFVLETTSVLGPAAAWVAAGATYATNGARISATVPAPNGQAWFRLRLQ